MVTHKSRTAKGRRKSAALKSKTAKPTGRQLEKVADDFEAQPAQMTKDQVEAIEVNFIKAGVIRRMALATLSLSGAQLRDAAIGDREGALHFAQLCAEAGDYAARLKEFAGLMETASTRLMMGICFREDGPRILREGEKRREVAHG